MQIYRTNQTKPVLKIIFCFCALYIYIYIYIYIYMCVCERHLPTTRHKPDSRSSLVCPCEVVHRKTSLMSSVKTRFIFHPCIIYVRYTFDFYRFIPWNINEFYFYLSFLKIFFTRSLSPRLTWIPKNEEKAIKKTINPIKQTKETSNRNKKHMEFFSRKYKNRISNVVGYIMPNTIRI